MACTPPGHASPMHARPLLGMHTPRHAPQARTPLRPSGVYYEIRSMSGRYASYWNAFLFCRTFTPKMATSGEPAGHVTRKQIVRLATAISADNMESIAEGYMDICNETVKNMWRENQGKVEAFNRDVLRYWTNKNSDPSQIRVRIFFAMWICFSAV